jgi:hypothetical protein
MEEDADALSAALLLATDAVSHDDAAAAETATLRFSGLQGARRQAAEQQVRVGEQAALRPRA